MNNLSSLNRALIALASFAILSATACLPDRMAWNPTGDRLTYLHADGSVWAWAPGGSNKEIFRSLEGNAAFCFDPGLASGALFVGIEHPKKNPTSPTEETIRDLRLVQPGTLGRVIAPSFSAEAGMTAQADGRRAWFITENKPETRWELWSLDPSASTPEPKLAFHQKKAFAYPCASPDGARILFTTDQQIGVYDTDAATTRSLIKSADEVHLALYGVWALGGGSVAYIETHPKVKDPKASSDLGELCVFDTATGQTRRLGGGFSILRRPMLDKSGEVAFLTYAKFPADKPQPEMDEVEPKNVQIQMINLKSGVRSTITHAPFGAYWPAPDPNGYRIGYVSNPKPGGDTPADQQIPMLFDRQTGRTETLGG